VITITEELRNQIKNVKLTKKEKLIAEFVLDNFPEVCFITSTDIAKRLNISDSSVIRFTRTLGYSGFMDFQRNIRKIYTDRINSVSEAITVPSERLKLSISKLGQSDVMETYFSNVIKNLKSVITYNDIQTFERATELIISSQRKFVVSSRANSGIGDMLLLLLKHMLPNVYETSHPALNVIDHLCDIGEKDCLIAVSFPRYSEMDLLAAQMAYDAGAQIVLITDKASSPLAQYATQLICVSVESNTFFNSYVSVLFAAELLCSFISKKVGYSNETKLDTIDKYLSKVGLF
jgi:DNA-binding MurR/RpiR family transcriptional regulator